MDRTKSWLGADYNAYVDNSNEQPDSGTVLETILVVDDDSKMLQSVKDLLECYGYHCLTASNGQQALQQLNSNPTIDLLILDLNMPDVDGHDILKQISHSDTAPDVIVVSGEASFDRATQVLRHGVHDYLRKPYLPEDLIHAIERVSTKRRMERKVHAMHQRLLNSEQRHRFIVNNSPDIIYMLDSNGCFSFVNERIKSLLGYEPEELVGCHFSKLIHKDDREKAEHSFSERRTGARASHNIEFRLLHKNADNNHRYFESHSITIELSAMGVYAESEQPRKGFIGTYGVIRDISERKRAEELVNFQLYHDLLTKLPNRALFRDRLKQAIAHAKRNQSQLAVMYLDMDRFKIINDSLGHLVGDQLLQTVAVKLRSCLRDSDTLARVGGDEFNLLLPNINSEQDATIIATKILREIEKPMVLEGIEVFISFSIGIAVYPQDGETIDSLIKHADTAMYHVKEHGKKNFEFYDASMKTKHTRHLSLESGLRKALDQDELRVEYQPQVDIDSGNVTGVEALIRWEHPENGLIPPSEFIPLTEETGLITDMGRWLLDSACATIKHWAAQGLPEVTLAVNVSARELMQSDFTDYVINTLKHHNLPGHMLELEITENVLMRDMEQSVHKLKKLAAYGIRIAVDDFGTGYSSLSYLQNLPLNTLKIDRSFIADIGSGNDSNTIIYAIVAMAKGLDLNLVAEGVENEDQLKFLKKIGCPTVQGYLTGHPSPSDEVWSTFSKAAI
ncbi:MAG: EAL domain-containing protein [Motiliproteus sp.]|nr:EAL domain-containing protein [Motiliproteus sp.]MCW9052081.1 EAL domain-containing protein [Motiliproteus sp.]